MCIQRARKWQDSDGLDFLIFGAEYCLSYYQSLYPEDTRLEEVLRIAKQWSAAPNEELRKELGNQINSIS